MATCLTASKGLGKGTGIGGRGTPETFPGPNCQQKRRDLCSRNLFYFLLSSLAWIHS